MCRVCSVALWILQFIAILYEPAHEITVLPGVRAMKAQISLGKSACSSESHQKTRPRGYKTFFQSQLKLRLKSLSLSSPESEFKIEVIKLSECDLS